MANGNTDLIREMKRIIEDGKPLDIDTRDRMLFSAVIDIYEQIEISRDEAKKRDAEFNAKLEKFQPAMVFYRVGMYFASAIGLSVVAFIGMMLTGQVEVIFK